MRIYGAESNSTARPAGYTGEGLVRFYEDKKGLIGLGGEHLKSVFVIRVK